MTRGAFSRIGVVVLLSALACAGEARSHAFADTTAPTVTQPADVTVVADAAGSANVPFTVDASDPDNATSTLQVWCNWGLNGKVFAPGATSQTFSVGTWDISCYATDPAGNTSSTVTFKINVAPYGSPTGDSTPPTIVQPADLTVVATSTSNGGEATPGFTVDAADPDNPESTLTIHCNWGLDGKQFAAGATSATFTVGSWTISCYASDPAGNTSNTIMFKINVAPMGSPTGDSTGPTLVQPADVTVVAGAGGSASVPFTVDATDPDNPESTLAMHCNWGLNGKQFTAGVTSQEFSVGTWTISCYASDPAGNTSSTDTFKVTVAPYGSSSGSSAPSSGSSSGGNAAGSASTTAGTGSDTGGSGTTTNGGASSGSAGSENVTATSTPSSASSLSDPVTITVPVALKPVELSSAHPAITVTTKMTQSTTLVFALLSANGQVLTRWIEHAKAGRRTMSLTLPVRARHAGRDTLRITPRGARTSTIRTVTLRA